MRVLEVDAGQERLVPRLARERRVGLMRTRVVGAYHLGGKLGRGTYGTVWSAWVQAPKDDSHCTSAKPGSKLPARGPTSWRSNDSHESASRRSLASWRSTASLTAFTSLFASFPPRDTVKQTRLAVKVVRPSPVRHEGTSVERVAREVLLQAQCHHHPGVCKVFDFLISDHGLFVVLELAQGKDLFATVVEAQSLRIGRTRSCLLQLVAAVAHMHRLDIAHCDIKPENVLLRVDGNLDSLVLCDFGHAVRWHEGGELLTGSTGTVRCMPPEVVAHRDGKPQQYNPKAVDVWSLGVLAFFLFTGQFPFDGANDKETAHNITCGQLTHGFPSKVPPAFLDLLERMLWPDFAARLTIEQVAAHPFLCPRARR